MIMPQTDTTVNQELADFRDYLLGMDMYTAKAPPELCTNVNQLRGWRSACKADSECSVGEYLAQQEVDRMQDSRDAAGYGRF